MTAPADAYTRWRSQGGAALAFREARSRGLPPERWLQEVWAHQRIRRDALQTTAGRRLTILHPGFWNREAGPDFLRAIIQIDDGEPVSGDIEIDLESSGWKSHGHAANPAYHDVVLHVVWDPPPGDPPLTTLALKPVLDAPLEELEAWVGGAGEVPVEWLAGRCCAPLQTLAHADVEAILHQASLARLETKAGHFRARARLAGWHQALWEGVFRALGYKHNAWPMQRLAELLPAAVAQPVEGRDLRQAWEARLLGLSGLLPAEPRSGTHARTLWDLWWRERAAFQDHALPADLWRLNGVRPANHPQRRVALAAAWIADPEWIPRLEAWFHAGQTGRDAEHGFADAVRATTPGFWRRHYTLDGRVVPDASALLGTGRINDLAVNAVLPWFRARADAGADPAARTRVEGLYASWSAGEDNAVLKLVRSRLFGDETLRPGRSAALQQGLLQIAHDFCAYSNAVCDNCPFPALVASL